MRRLRARLRTLLLASTVVAAIGCDRPVVPAAAEEKLAENLPQGIHPVLSLGTAANGGAELKLFFRSVGVESGISSYQGELRYDAAAVQLASARVGDGVMGAWNESEPGVVKFAGASLEAIGERPVLILQVSSRGPIRAEAFRVRVDEVTAHESLRSLAEHLVVREHPVLLRATPK